MAVCPQCGTENPEGARFCNECAALLERVVRSGEQRKVVTVLFCDVVGSTALGDAVDPEVLRGSMRRYFEQARAVLERHGGTVEKFIGDAVVAVFGVPQVHEDDALRAVRAAHELRGQAELAIRIGVNTGAVVVGDPGERQSFATGDAVNVAARLEQAAMPGEILIGEPTYRLVEEAVRAELVEPLTLKGKPEPVPAYRLLDVLPGVPAFTRPLDAAFVAREAELAELRSAFTRAVAERRCVLSTVAGPPGIGKSRLARELATAVAADARLVVGRCLAYGEGITYWPLAEVVRGLAGDDPRRRLEELLADDEDAALVAERIAGALGVPGASGRAEETPWAFRRLFEALARERPLLAVLDDIHWAEPPLLDLLEYLAGFSRDAPMLVLCLTRPELLDLRPAWARTGLISLEPLSDAETDELIESRASGLPVEQRARVLEAAEGNPLFVEQLLALQAEDDQTTIPPTIQALLAARIDRLESGERAVIEAASVEGRLFHRDAVAQLVSPDMRLELGSNLMALVRKQFVWPDQALFRGDDGFRFAHNLIRDAAYESLPKSSRAKLHERFADWLDAKAAELLERDELSGYHLEQAYRYRAELGAAAGDLGLRAGERLAAAGRRALRRKDVVAAVNLLERAVSLLPAETREIDVDVDLGEALRHAGRLGDAEAVFSQAAERAAARGDRPAELLALLEREKLVGQTRPTETSNDELSTLAEEAIDVFAEAGDDLRMVQAFRALSWAERNRQRAALGNAAWEQALAHARRAGDEQLAEEIRTDLALGHVQGPTPVDEAARLLQELRELVPRRPQLLVYEAELEAMRGHFERARQLVTEFRVRAEELGLHFSVAYTEFLTHRIEMMAGNPAAAAQAIGSACRRLEQIGQKALLSTYAADFAQVLCALERYDEAEEWTIKSRQLGAADDVGTQMLWRQAQAKVLAHRGEPVEAERLAREAVDLAGQTDLLNEHGDALIDLAEVLELSRQQELAAAQIEQALALYERKGNTVMAGKARARLAELHGVA